MKIPSVSDLFAKMASSKTGQKIYKKLLNPKNDAFWDETLPIVESTVATTAYIINAELGAKDVDRKSKNAIQIQNVLSWVISVAISIPMNKKINKFTKAIEKQLKPELMEDFHKVSKGLAIAGPLLAVTVLNRALIPSVLVPISSIIRDKHEQHKKNNLDLKV